MLNNVNRSYGSLEMSKALSREAFAMELLCREAVKP